MDGVVDIAQERRIRELQRLCDDPEIRARIIPWLAIEEQIEMSDEALNLRIPKGWKGRADDLAKHLVELEQFQVFRMNMSTVFRMAIERGLEYLEKEYLDEDAEPTNER